MGTTTGVGEGVGSRAAAEFVAVAHAEVINIDTRIQMTPMELWPRDISSFLFTIKLCRVVTIRGRVPSLPPEVRLNIPPCLVVWILFFSMKKGLHKSLPLTGGNLHIGGNNSFTPLGSNHSDLMSGSIGHFLSKDNR